MGLFARTTTLFLVSAGLTAVLALHVAAEDGAENFEVEKGFHGERAGDLSGIACVPLDKANSYRCLVVNDENQTAQLAKIKGRKIKAKEKITLIEKEGVPEPLGKKPKRKPKDVAEICPNGKAEFNELDGEGVAYAAPYFYVVGSHGCSRKKGKFRLSTFVLARIRVDDQGQPVDASGKVLCDKEMSKELCEKEMSKAVVEITYRLSDLLPRTKEAGDYFGNAGVCRG